MFHVLLCFSYTKIPFYLYLSFQVQSGQTWFKILTLSLWKWFRFNNNSLSAYYLKFPNRRFWNFYNLFSFSSFLALKVKYLRHLLINHPNFFSESSYRNYLKFKKKYFIQPPGEPWKHRLCEVRATQKFHKKTWRVDILWRIFEKIA